MLLPPLRFAAGDVTPSDGSVVKVARPVFRGRQDWQEREPVEGAAAWVWVLKGLEYQAKILIELFSSSVWKPSSHTFCSLSPSFQIAHCPSSKWDLCHGRDLSSDRAELLDTYVYF